MDTKDEAATTAMQLATEIVVAFLARADMSPEGLPRLVREVRSALEDAPPRGEQSKAPSIPVEEVVGVENSPPASTALEETQPEILLLTPAVPIEESVTDEYLVSLEDGQRYRSLRRHLMAKYGMTPDQYRAKWSLPQDYPMVAPSYAQERSAVAKRIGLGRGGRPLAKKGTGVKVAPFKARK